MFGHVSYTQKKCQNCQCSSRCRSTSSQPSKIKMEQLTYLETITVHALTSEKNIQKNLGIKLSKVHFNSLVVQHKSMSMIQSQSTVQKINTNLWACCFVSLSYTASTCDMLHSVVQMLNGKNSLSELRTYTLVFLLPHPNSTMFRSKNQQETAHNH